MELTQIKVELKKMVPDFAKKVAPVYELLNWEWSPHVEVPHVPSESEIGATLIELIDDLTDKGFRVGTGGLEVSYSLPDEAEGGEYGLYFIIEATGHNPDKSG